MQPGCCCSVVQGVFPFSHGFPNNLAFDASKARASNMDVTGTDLRRTDDTARTVHAGGYDALAGDVEEAREAAAGGVIDLPPDHQAVPQTSIDGVRAHLEGPRGRRAVPHAGHGRPLTTAAMLAATLLAGCPASRAPARGDTPMNCEASSAHSLASEIASANAASVYAPSTAARSTTRFRVAMPRLPGAGALLLVKSNRVADWLYRGPAAREIALHFDSRLGDDGGHDTLTFYLLDPERGRACSWTNERSQAYWRDGAKVDIRLLDEGDFGADGLYRQFDVTLR
jgi:hypothetical protein